MSQQAPPASVLARALYDYTAANKDELSFKRDDILEVLEREESGKWRCRLRGETNAAPSELLCLLQFEDESPLFVKALYSYTAADRHELSFEEGDILKVYGKAGSGWWDCMLRGERNWAPSNYLEIPVADPLLDIYAKAKYDYTAETRGDLSFKEGDVIRVLSKAESGWWDCLLRGERGVAPSNFLEIVPSAAGSGKPLPMRPKLWSVYNL